MAGSPALPDPLVLDIQDRHDAILALGKQRKPTRERKAGIRGHVRQRPAHNLAQRLSDHRDGVLPFVTDLWARFHSKRAERDVHMPTLKQKVCGCLCSNQGIAHLAIIRPYRFALRKQSPDICRSLGLTSPSKAPISGMASEWITPEGTRRDRCRLRFARVGEL